MSTHTQTAARLALENAPPRIRNLPVYGALPVPWFVAWIDGVPDHRVADGEKQARALTERRCWICGDPLEHRLAFLVGPMCVVTGTSGEPPQHRGCARYAARTCPFLVQPARGRREVQRDDVAFHEGGLRRNPGAVAIVYTRSFRWMQGIARMGMPFESVEWFAEGREATRAEVETSIASGLPLLAATVPEDSPDHAAAMEELDALHHAALGYLP